MWLGFVSVCGERTGPWSLNEVLKGDSVTIEPGGSLAAVLRKSASADGFPHVDADHVGPAHEGGQGGALD